MKLKHYIIYFTYQVGDEEFRYQRLLSSEKSGDILKFVIQDFIADIECVDSNWHNNTLELDNGTKIKIDYYKNIPSEDYKVLAQYL